MNLTRDIFGTTADGTEVAVFTISNSSGYEIRCMSYGATLISVKAPGRDGSVQEITLGYDSLDDYLAGHPFLGSTAGRVCNRIGGARFTVNGQEFTLPANDGPNTLHGGPGGFHVRVWEAEAFQSDTRAGVLFQRTSPDGEEGFPGNVGVTITISLTEDNEIEFEYRAETDKPTPVNLTNHAYWNLAGAPDLGPSISAASAPGGAIGAHRVQLNCDKLIDVDEASIPTGKILAVAGTPFDFTSPKTIGADIESAPGKYDHCFLLTTPGTPEVPAVAAVVEDLKSGRRMEVLTTLPAVQFYSGNMLGGTKSRGSVPYEVHSALCLETQLYIDAVSQPSFPSMILQPGEVFEHRTIHRFSVIK
jgi:aldose 1-epimerase